MSPIMMHTLQHGLIMLLILYVNLINLDLAGRRYPTAVLGAVVIE